MITVTMSGPLFQGNAAAKSQQAVEGAVRELVEKGHERLNEMLRPRPSGVYLSVGEARKGRASTGYYRQSIHTEVRGTLGRIDDSKVVYGPWLEGIGSRNETTRFKGYASFRRTAQWLQSIAQRVLEAHAKNLVQDLS